MPKILHNAFKLTPHIAPKLSNKSPHTFERILGFHINGHDTSVCVVEKGIVKQVIEFERVLRDKHCRVNVLHSKYKKILSWLFEEYNLARDFDAVALEIHYYGTESKSYYELVQDEAVEQLMRYIPNAHYVQFPHHLCHAASGYFTSPFNEAVVLSFDGHGNDGYTIGFHSKGNELSYLKDYPFSLGRSYVAMGNFIGGIKSLDGDSSGKLMGLTSYGEIIYEWIEPIKDFIKTYQGIRSEFSPVFWEASVADGLFNLPGIGPILAHGLLGGPENQISQDFAATFQRAWTDVVIDIVSQLIDSTGVKNLCVVGGCALNAITNLEIANHPNVNNVHFVPHPNDSGLAIGAALYCYYSYQNMVWQPNINHNGYFSPYLGIPILDRSNIPEIASNRNAKYINNPAEVIAGMIAEGQIIGIIQGNSEIGPRALGNRSILCDPTNSRMKEILNNRVKGREWYRPFAPVVRAEDIQKYFFTSVESPYMSVVGYVKEEWRDKLPAITHIDGSARIQTVKYNQNEFLWNILTAFSSISGIGVLLNTSFNGKGEPIISKLSEALELMDKTALDAVYCEGWLFEN